MNPIKFAQNAKELARYLRHDLPREVGVMGEVHFKESFQKEGFTDKVFVNWDEVQRRKPEYQKLTRKRGKTRRSQKYSKAERTRAILTGETGDLGDSIRWDADYNKVVFSTDVPYAQAHNEGTTSAGRGRKTKIPQRKFMGESQVLTQKVKNMLDQKTKEIFKRA